MKMNIFNNSYGYYKSIIALVLGIVLVVWPESAVNLIIIVLGALALLFGTVSIVVSLKKEESESNKKSLLTMNGLASVVLGLVLIIFPTFFAGVVMFLFGAMLLVSGVFEISNLVSLKKSVDIPVSLFVGPVITALCGIIIFFNPFATTKLIFIFFGASLILYAITSYLSTHKVNSLLNDLKSKSEKDSFVKDVDFEEVD